MANAKQRKNEGTVSSDKAKKEDTANILSGQIR
jgi:hypothetical protein